ncbi:MAG TPA: chemotaxis protein CheW [Polyangiaceae bacterium]|nr:chemotaxis protein CheW [Polyangiaceae bacterium]
MEQSFSSIDRVASATSAGGEYLTFSVGDEEYACDILSVQEIRAMTQITPIPNSPDCVRGVMNLRGIVVPVISLRAMLGLPGPEDGKFRVIVVVTVGAKIVGLSVDAVSDVLRLDVSEVPLPTEFGHRVDASVVAALGTLNDKFIVVLDVPSVAERAGLVSSRTG